MFMTHKSSKCYNDQKMLFTSIAHIFVRIQWNRQFICYYSCNMLLSNVFDLLLQIESSIEIIISIMIRSLLLVIVVAGWTYIRWQRQSQEFKILTGQELLRCRSNRKKSTKHILWHCFFNVTSIILIERRRRRVYRQLWEPFSFLHYLLL